MAKGDLLNILKGGHNVVGDWCILAICTSASATAKRVEV